MKARTALVVGGLIALAMSGGSGQAAASSRQGPARARRRAPAPGSSTPAPTATAPGGASPPPPSRELDEAATVLARNAAFELRAYLLDGGASREQVKIYQRKMGVEPVTGLVGHITAARARQLGVELPPFASIPAAVRARA